MEFKDYYQTLGVGKDASTDEIKRAYRKLARQYHPDINKESGAAAKFQEANEAHEVLKDPEKRAKYDRYGAAWQDVQQGEAPPSEYEDLFRRFSGGPRRSQTYSFGGSDFSDFFEELFGNASRQGGQQSWQGADYEAVVSLTLEEAAAGGKRQFSLPNPQTGTNKTYAVKIPPGIKPGQRIRLAGQGSPGGGSGRSGDLYLVVDILPHPHFRLEGGDIHTLLPVSPWVAALGGKVPMKTLDGTVNVSVPPKSSSGRKIRLRGKGFPAAGGPGDFYAEIQIRLPDKLTGREKELFEELAAASDFVPSAG